MNLPASAGDVGLIAGSRRSPREGNGNSLQYPCLENPVDRGAWQAISIELPKPVLLDRKNGQVLPRLT